MDLSGDSIVAVNRSKELLSCELGEEQVVLDCHSGIYYGLNEIGARIWQLIQKPESVGAIHGLILEEYDIDADQCLRDITSLLDRMLENGLIVIVHEPDA